MSGCKAEILVGPGNKFVAEAKRILYGKIVSDLLAGPTKIVIIAYETADPSLVLADLIVQAKHGFDSPAWLVTTNQNFAKKVLLKM